MRADVIVVGLGSMGAAAACELARRGVAVIGVDRFTPPHERGAHAGGSRIIRWAYMEGAAYVPLVRRSYTLWRELETAAGQTLLSTTGGLMLGRPDSVAVGGALAAARAHGLAHELLDAAQVRHRFPVFTPHDEEVGLYEEIAGLIRPETAIQALLDRARGYGAGLLTGVTVRGWDATAGGITVRTSDGTLCADRLVLAPGAWAPGLVRVAVGMRVERRVQHYWRPAGEPAAFEPGRFPVWIWNYGPGLAAYGLPGVDDGVKAALHHGGEVTGPESDPDAGAASWTRGEVVDPDVGAAPATPAEVAAMRAWLHGHLPGLGCGEWLGAKPCLYTLTPDEHFVLGPHPDHPNVAVACGFSGHGFKFAPVVGEILADLALTAATPYDIALFSPSRFTTSVAA